MNVAVVGAGIAGLSAARFLSRRGHAVTLFEQFDSIHHAFGSSHGRSRIVRRAYPDAFYTACMMEAYPMWSELQEESGVELLHEVGLLYFGGESSPDLCTMVDGLASLSVEHQVLGPTEARRVMHDLWLDEGEIAVFTPEAGWVHAEAALRATWALAQASGATARFGERSDRAALEKFDAFVICAGAWTSDWADLDVAVTAHTFAYFKGVLAGPVWIEDSPGFPYGFPSEGDSPTFKIGIHRAGLPIDPGQGERTVNPEALDIAIEVARRRFGLRTPEIVDAQGCLYTDTPDEDFRFARLGSRGFLATACSGHGFKFGPWIGSLLADFVEGKDAPENHSRFFRATS